MINVETDIFCAPHRVTNKKNVTLCLDADWDWAQKLLEKFSSTDVETKQMKLDYSECVRNLKKRP